MLLNISLIRYGSNKILCTGKADLTLRSSDIILSLKFLFKISQNRYLKTDTMNIIVLVILLFNGKKMFCQRSTSEETFCPKALS